MSGRIGRTSGRYAPGARIAEEREVKELRRDPRIEPQLQLLSSGPPMRQMALDGDLEFNPDGDIYAKAFPARKTAPIANKFGSTYVATRVLKKTASNRGAIQPLNRQALDFSKKAFSIKKGAVAYTRVHRLGGSVSDDNRAGQVSQPADLLAITRRARAEAEVPARTAREDYIHDRRQGSGVKRCAKSSMLGSRALGDGRHDASAS